MEAATNKRELFRLLDANINRLREGIRVVEDVARYLLDEAELAAKLKSLRHAARLDSLNHELLASRDSVGDVARVTTTSETVRPDLRALVAANCKRAEESARVLEEALKLVDATEAERFKGIRYALYDLEKRLLLHFS
ncbi:MAG: thiamine-phosphate pyrophosphorylase [Campylobacterales bacterium]